MINGPPATNRDDPRQGDAFSPLVVSRLPPYLEKAVLNHIFDIVMIVDDAGDDRPKQRMVPVKQGVEGRLIAAANPHHELFVADVGRCVVRAFSGTRPG
jgi:hypothetical protein